LEHRPPSRAGSFGSIASYLRRGTGRDIFKGSTLSKREGQAEEKTGNTAHAKKTLIGSPLESVAHEIGEANREEKLPRHR